MSLPPFIASEVSSRMFAAIPDMREVFAKATFETTGEDLETFLRTIWLIGYGEGIHDATDSMDGNNSALLDWAMKQDAA